MKYFLIMVEISLVYDTLSCLNKHSKSISFEKNRWKRWNTDKVMAKFSRCTAWLIHRNEFSAGYKLHEWGLVTNYGTLSARIFLSIALFKYQMIKALVSHLLYCWYTGSGAGGSETGTSICWVMPGGIVMPISSIFRYRALQEMIKFLMHTTMFPVIFFWLIRTNLHSGYSFIPPVPISA